MDSIHNDSKQPTHYKLNIAFDHQKNYSMTMSPYNYLYIMHLETFLSSSNAHSNNSTHAYLSQLIQVHRHLRKTNTCHKINTCWQVQETVSMPRTAKIYHHSQYTWISERQIGHHKTFEIKFGLFYSKRTGYRSPFRSKKDILDPHLSFSTVHTSARVAFLARRWIPTRFLLFRCHLLLHVQSYASR